MEQFIRSFCALLSGILFGLGMVVSGMINPKIVIGFLDIAGDWNPSLVFVMVGALIVFIPCYFLLIHPREKPLLAQQFHLVKTTKINKKLVIGATLFGIGWGLAGICPGPSVASLALGNMDMVLFFCAMLIGLAAANKAINKMSQSKNAMLEQS